jgi:hypothetical protein
VQRRVKADVGFNTFPPKEPLPYRMDRNRYQLGQTHARFQQRTSIFLTASFHLRPLCGDSLREDHIFLISRTILPPIQPNDTVNHRGIRDNSREPNHTRHVCGPRRLAESDVVMAHAITVAIPTELADQPDQLVALRAVALDDRWDEDS